VLYLLLGGAAVHRCSKGMVLVPALAAVGRCRMERDSFRSSSAVLSVVTRALAAEDLIGRDSQFTISAIGPESRSTLSHLRALGGPRGDGLC
jgi:hypothetical protein